MTIIAIIGAGAAGIGAARRLRSRGRDVLLIDALDRLGGRAWTVEAAGLPVDLGCGWLHSAERNPWVGIAEAAGIAVNHATAVWQDQLRNLGFSAGEQYAAGAAFEAFNTALAAHPPASDVAADALPADPTWHPYLDALSGYINGARLADLSAEDYLAYDQAASERNWRVESGYGALIAGAAQGIPTALGTKVRAIDLSGSQVTLETDRGTITAAAAIVTVSTDVLARGGLRLPAAFDPILNAAAHLPLGLADKLYLHLADGGAVPPESHLLGNPHSTDTGSYYMRPFGRPLIECFFGADHARALEQGGMAAMTAFAREELGRLLGSDFAAGLAPVAASSWASVPSIGGSYSHALPGHAAARQAFARSPDPRIAFAGEACSITDFSTAHGAYQTGVEAADRIEAAL